jgi:hypothetical protein
MPRRFPTLLKRRRRNMATEVLRLGPLRISTISGLDAFLILVAALAFTVYGAYGWFSISTEKPGDYVPTCGRQTMTRESLCGIRGVPCMETGGPECNTYDQMVEFHYEDQRSERRLEITMFLVGAEIAIASAVAVVVIERRARRR